MCYIRLAGFGGIIDCGYRQLDDALVTALVERWRPETHTFHLPVGECTITLQDIQVLWGLPIDGDVISGIDVHMNKPEIIKWFLQLTGCSLPYAAISGNKINLIAVLNEIKEVFPENATDQQCIYRARLIIYYLIGATIFNTSATKAVHIKFLTHIENFTTCGRLSWGSAVLAFLYRQLCKATFMRTREVCGPLFLLQLWAWERLPTLAPLNNQEVDFQKPYGARWQGCNVIKSGNTTAHCLSAYRSSLHSINDTMFIWRPYDHIIQRLLEKYRNGHLCWSSDTFLICWEYVEPHCASRVLRKFGMVQPIPRDVPLTREEHFRLHSIARKGEWASRHNKVVQETYSDSTVASQEYMMWYREHTVEYITNPSHQAANPRGFQNDGQRMSMLMDGMDQFYQQPGDEIGRNMARRYMDYAHADHVGYLPTHVIENLVDVLFPPVPQRLRRRGRGQGRVGRQAGEDNEEQQNMRKENFEGGQFSQMGNPNFFVGGSSGTQFEGGSSALFEMGNLNYDAGGSSNTYVSPHTNILNPFQQSEPLPYYPQFQEMDQVVARFSNASPCPFDLNNEVIETDEDSDAPGPTQFTQGNDLNENVANRTGRRHQIRRPGCGTH